MTTTNPFFHRHAVNKAIAKLLGMNYLFHDNSRGAIHTENGWHNWMESWHDAGPLVEEMKIKIDFDNSMKRWKARAWHMIDGDDVWGWSVETPLPAICYAYLRSQGVENPERLGVE